MDRSTKPSLLLHYAVLIGLVLLIAEIIQTVGVPMPF